MSLQNQLAKLEAAIAAKQKAKTQQVKESKLAEIKAKYAAMSDAEVSAEYDRMCAEMPPTPPEELARLKAMTDQEIIDEYLQMIKAP